MTNPMSDPEGFRARYEQSRNVEVSPRRAELFRLTSAARVLIDRMMQTEAPLEALRTIADHMEALAAELDAQPRGRGYYGFAESANAGDTHGFFDFSPVIGAANPLAPPLVLHVDGGVVRGTGVFGAAYEGPPGHVHGGIVAASFDEVLGMVQSMTGNPGMTGLLTVRYRRPTPLHTELTFTGRVVRVDGRKIFTEATLHHGDILCAEAEGLFISVDFEKFSALAADRGRPMVNRPLP